MEKKQVKTKENRKHETLYKEAKTRNNIYIYRKMDRKRKTQKDKEEGYTKTK
jgi:hypothetical protein